MLFDKPVSELREVFVRNRFAEEKYFGRPDIEEWLAGQRKAKEPDEEQWNHCISSSDRMIFYARDNPIEFLRDYAEPSSSLPQSSLKREELEEQVEHRAKLRPILESFASDKVDIYYPYVHSPIVVWKGECEATPEAFYLNLSHDANGHPTTTITYGVPSPMVMDTIFAAWWRGTRKASRARKLLCDLLAHDISKMRMEAEVDFESAVAVSADGKKIVIAQFVAVVPSPGQQKSVLLYRNVNAFRTHKILRVDRFRKNGSLFGELVDAAAVGSAVSQFFRVCGGHSEQMFVHGGREENLFIVMEEHCQQPLPEGGEEVFTLL